MAFVLNEGRGKKVAIYSTCADVSYAHAEVLLFNERIKAKTPNAFIVGFADSQVAISVERFLEPYKKTPIDLTRLEELRAEVKLKGFPALTVRMFTDDFTTFLKSRPDLEVGRSAEDFVSQLADFRKAGQATEEAAAELLEDLFANPLHAGVHYRFPPSVPDETWVADAAKCIRRTSPERWLRRLLVILRFYLQGQPKVQLPNKNDRCPCESTRKYGKCCGQGVEHEDPEDCKLGMHEFSDWRKVSDKYVRSCERCYRVYDAPWFEDTIFDGVAITVIGCRGCGQRPSEDEIHQELGRAITFNTCGCCGKPFKLASLIVEHSWHDGKHLNKWVYTEMLSAEKTVDVDSKCIGQGAFVHPECFAKAMPAWLRVAKPLNKKDADSEISRILPPEGY